MLQPVYKPIMNEFESIASFFAHVGAAPGLHKDFDIRTIESTNICSMEMPPFRNRIYAICLYTEIETYCEHYADFQKPSSSKPSLFFKIPYQILSWNAIQGTFKGYYIFMEEDFLLKYKHLTDLVFDLPFLRHDQTLPCEIDSDELTVLKKIFEDIHIEYHGNKNDKFDLIVAYLQVLLHQIKRVYSRSAALNPDLAYADNKNNRLIAERFVALLDSSFKEMQTNHNRTVTYYAEQLCIHRNYLNAAVKRISGKTAHELIQNFIIRQAKTLLCQSSLSIKEIAFQLSFSDPAHFTKFFKNQTSFTPVLFRAQQVA